jgi:protease I
MKIACLLSHNFEDSEFQQPYQAFQQAGHIVVIVGIKEGEELAGKNQQVRAVAEKSIKDVSPADFDAMFIPGGYSPDQLRADDSVVRFVQQMVDERKPVLAICHGPQLLLTADRYKNNKMTAWKTVQGDLRKAGAHVVDAPVVIDRNFITSRMPADIPTFVDASLLMLNQPGLRRTA